jgi:glycosyltransferase involved in cell wall biosynthesis
MKQETVLLLLGAGGGDISKAVSIETVNLGYIDEDRLKAVAYCAADLYIHPTRADNLPLVLQESMACGTPMVSFNVGGVPDLVRPGVTGYLAEPENAEDLCRGITLLLEDKSARSDMGERCRKIAVEEYSLELQTERYITLYREIISRQLD